MAIRRGLILAGLAAGVCGAAPALRAAGGAPLSIDFPSSTLPAGGRFHFDATLRQAVPQAFDVYCVANSSYGPFSIAADGWLYPGVVPAARNIPRAAGPFSARVNPFVTLPRDLRGTWIRFYLYLTQAGKSPPISNVDELGPDTAYVLLFDSKILTVE